MLTLTPAAAEVVRRILADAAPEDTAGLRIAPGEPTPEGVAFEMTLVNAPEEDDETVEEEGATIFLEPAAAEMLDDKILDAEVADDQVRFAVIDPQEFGPTRNGSTPD
jgi:Fe-S cluster assembly iron-binding protein IscA